MAIPNDRRVIWGAHVVPQVSFSTTDTQVTREEGSTAGIASYTKYKLDTSIATTSILDGISLSSLDNLWEVSDNVWEDTLSVWGYIFSKRFGGKGSVDIKSDQGTDEWVSFLSPVDSLWEAVDNIWEDTSAVFDNAFSVGDTPGTTHPTNLRTDGGTVDFLYVKNLGSVECQLALEGNEYDILIPGGAAVSMRVNSISASDIKVQTASSTTTIEFIIARTP